MADAPTKHPSPTLGYNTSRFNPYDGVDRGLAIWTPDSRYFYRVKRAVWTSYGFESAPGIMEFTLEKFLEFPGPSTPIEGPGLGGSFNCATRTYHNNPCLIEEAAHHIYNNHYLLGGPLLVQEEITPLQEMGRAFVLTQGKPYQILSAVSTLTFESEDGIKPIKPIAAEITYSAVFAVPTPNPGDTGREIREYIIQVDPLQFDAYAQIVAHIKQIRESE